MKKIIYVANSIDKEIQVLNINSDNSIYSIQKIRVDGYVQPLTISNNKKILYAGIRPIPKIITFKILNDGTLKKIHEILIIGYPNHIALNKDETLLFCSSYHEGCVNVITIDSFGIPKHIINLFKDIQGCHYTSIYNSKTIFTTALKLDQIFMFNFKKNNITTKNSLLKIDVKKNSGPRHMVIHPKNPIIYTINEFNSTIDVWKIYDDIKQINFKQRISILPEHYTGKCWGADIHISPCGNYLYASDRITNILTVLIINKNNQKLKVLEHYVTEQQPRSFHIDTLGKFLTVVGEKSNNLTLYTIRKNKGHLNKVSTFSVGKNPIWVLIYRI